MVYVRKKDAKREARRLPKEVRYDIRAPPPPRRPSPHAPLASSVGRVAPLRSTTCFRKLLRRRFPPCPRAPRIYHLAIPGIYTPAVPRLYPALQCPGAYLGSTQSFVFRRIAEILARFRRKNDRTDAPHLFCFPKITQKKLPPTKGLKCKVSKLFKE